MPKQRVIIAAVLLFAFALFSVAIARPLTGMQSPKGTAPAAGATTGATPAPDTVAKVQKSIVDYRSDLATNYRTDPDSVIRLVGNVAFHHNGAFIECDSAVRYGEYKMEGFGNVIINKDSTYIYGDSIMYSGYNNTATVYSPLLKLVNGDATLYAYNQMDFNTMTSIGRYNQGGVIIQRDNLMESDQGIYNGDSSEVRFVGHVALRSDNYRIRTDSVSYNLNTEIVTFLTTTYIWDKDRDFLTAESGKYLRSNQTYYFTQDAYAMTPEQEFWADTMSYRSLEKEAVMYRNIQILDTTQRTLGLGDYGYYNDSLKRGMLTGMPSVIGFEEPDTLPARGQDSTQLSADTTSMISPAADTLSENSAVIAVAKRAIPDSTFMRADSIFFDSYPAGESRPKVVKPVSASPVLDTTIRPALDTLGTLGMADSAIRDGLSGPVADSATLSGGNAVIDSTAVVATEQTLDPESPIREAALPTDTVGMQGDTLGRPTIPPLTDSIRMADSADSIDDGATQSAMIQSDSLMTDSLNTDSLAADSLPGVVPIVADSTAAPKDSLERTIRAFHNVKIFRRDVQSVCDSLIGFSVDSVMHMIGRPVLWNENNQLMAEQRIDIYSRNGNLDYADYIGTPFIIQEVTSTLKWDTVRYNQAKGRFMQTWFKDNEIDRAQLTGNVMNLYYMESDKRVTQFAEIDCADLKMKFKNRGPSRMTWVGSPSWKIYPIRKIPADQSQQLVGFSWVPELRPKDRYEITTREIRPSERAKFTLLEQPNFTINEKLQQYREKLIQGGQWRDRSELIRSTIDTFLSGDMLF